MIEGSGQNPPNQTSTKVLVIGGGIAGLTAAWELARLNLDVELVEKSSFLGGHAIQFCCKAADECQKCGACSVEKRLLEVVEEPRIRVHLRAELEELTRNGRFSEWGIAYRFESSNLSLFLMKFKMIWKRVL